MQVQESQSYTETPVLEKKQTKRYYNPNTQTSKTSVLSFLKEKIAYETTDLLQNSDNQ